MELQTIESTVAALDQDTPTDVLLEWRDKVDAAKKIIRDVDNAVDEQMRLRCMRDGEIVFGTRRWYAAHEKKTKCNDVRTTTEAVMNAAAGDVDAFNACLSTNAYKHGACRKLLPPDVYVTCFTETVETVLKDGTPAQKQLQMVDDRFVR